MTRRATNFGEHLLTVEDSLFNLGIVGNHLPRDGHGRLEQGDGRDVRAGQLIRKPVAIGIATESKAFAGLHSVVLVKSGVAELTQ